MQFYQYKLDNSDVFLTPLGGQEGNIFSQLSQKGIRKYAFEGKKIVIIGNKSAYSAGIYCISCGHIPYCRFCDIPIAYHTTHEGAFFGLCHLCKTVYESPQVCEQCGSHEIKDFGVGLEQIKEWLQHQGISCLQISSATGNSPTKVDRIYQNIYQTNTLLGTSLLSNKPQNRNTDLLIFQSIDSFFLRPDFNATLDLINLLDHTIKSHQPKVFIIQTKNISNTILHQRASGKSDEIREQEYDHLKNHQYPPFNQLAVILYKHEIESNVYDTVHHLYRELCFLNDQGKHGLTIKAIPSIIYRKFGKFHYQIVILGPTVKEFLNLNFEKLKILTRGFKVDRNPKTLN